MLSSFNDLVVSSSVEVSIVSPFSFCAFPSENMTRILNNEDDLLTLTFLSKSWSLEFKGAVSQGFYCFRSILCENHYFEALIINKRLLQSYNEDIK